MLRDRGPAGTPSLGGFGLASTVSGLSFVELNWLRSDGRELTGGPEYVSALMPFVMRFGSGRAAIVGVTAKLLI